MLNEIKLRLCRWGNYALTAGIAVIFCLNSPALYAQEKTISYAESTEDFANPERGFYVAAGERPGELSAAKLEKLRTEYSIKTPSANYALAVTLVYRGYLLSEFTSKPLSETFLQQLQSDFKAVRDAGLKMILRFAYTNSVHKGDCPDKAICPPYGDAPKGIVLKHISQLKPLLHKNADIIAVVQQGFIGIWGENHYTDYFGDASMNGLGVIADSSWNDRNEMLKALLDALPKDRMVQVRTPQFKQRFVFGPKASVSSPALSEKDAFDGTDKARIGLHNDCFLASADDYGTFYDYGNSSSSRGPANEALRKYFEAESRYGAVGGETCDDAFSPQNDCAPAGHAEQEMAAMHYSFLNTSYNNLVNNDWEEQGCMFSIKRKLGYRLILRQASLPDALKSGSSFRINLRFENAGYASPYNPRPLELLLRNKETGKITAITLSESIQKWFTGPIELNQAVQLPQGLSKGNYELLLNLPDAYPSLKGRPEYSIRLANEGLWEEETGYNKLNSILKIN